MIKIVRWSCFQCFRYTKTNHTFQSYGVTETINNDKTAVLNRQLPGRWFRRMSTSWPQVSPDQITYVFSCGA